MWKMKTGNFFGFYIISFYTMESVAMRHKNIYSVCTLAWNIYYIFTKTVHVVPLLTDVQHHISDGIPTKSNVHKIP